MPILCFSICAALALIVTTKMRLEGISPIILVSIALFAGALLASEKYPRRSALGLLSAIGGLSLGLDSAVENTSAVSIVKGLLGNFLSLVVLVADVAIYVSFASDAKWMRIALRIVGSWLAAISLMVLAFAFGRKFTRHLLL